MKKRILSLILALLMIAPAMASCSESEVQKQNEAETAGTSGDTAPSDSAAEETEETRPYYESRIPEGLDYDGYDIKFLSGYEQDSLLDLEDENTGDVVVDAYWRRNEVLKDKLNVTLSLPQQADHLTFVSKAQQAVAAGTNDYQVFTGHTRHHATIAASGYLMNLNNVGAMEYIDLSQPYWNESFMNNVNYQDNLFWLGGDMTHNVLSYIYCVFVNAALLEDHHTGMNIYDLVFEGKWTLDKLSELSEGVYRDLNGNGQRDDTDQYAVIQQEGHTLNGMFFAAGVEFTGFNEEGEYAIILNSEHTVNLFEKLHTMFCVNENNALYSNADFNTKSTELFTQDRLLFCPQMFQFAGTDGVREMETDFYVIPMPKYDESQENYRAIQWDGVPVYGVPTSLPEDMIPMVSIFLESCCAVTSELVLPAYYDVALKNKYSRDPVAAQMMDIIKSNVTSDFAFLWGESVSNIIDFLYTNIKNDNIASAMKSSTKMWNKQLGRLIDKLEEASE